MGLTKKVATAPTQCTSLYLITVVTQRFKNLLNFKICKNKKYFRHQYDNF